MGSNSSNSNSNLRGPKTLEEKLIEQILTRAKDVKLIPGQVRSVLSFQTGAGSDLYKYVGTQLVAVERHLEETTILFQKLEDLMAETSIVGQLSRREMKRRALHLIRKLGVEEAQKLLDQVKNEGQEVPESVVFIDEYRARKQKERVLGLTKKPEGAA